MTKPSNTPNKKPKFSFYWIYAIILLVFIVFPILNGGGLQEENNITQSQYNQFLREGDIEKIDVVRNTHVAKIYLTKEAENKEIHKKSVPTSFFPTSTQLPNYQFKFGDMQNFENRFAEIRDKENLNTEIVYSEESNLWGDFLISMLPFIILIAIWIYIMRRMSSGAGGGAG